MLHRVIPALRTVPVVGRPLPLIRFCASNSSSSSSSSNGGSSRSRSGSAATPRKAQAVKFQLKTFRPMWGVDTPWEVMFPRIVQEGYSGIDTILPPVEQRSRMRDLLDADLLDAIVLIFTSGRTVDEHLETFERELEAAKALRPLLVNVHSGVDCWTYEQGRAFFQRALEIERRAGVRVAHETHRGRILFNPRDTLMYLRAYPDLKITADFSHWVVACERLPFDQAEAFALAAQRTLHVHARVGHEQGPQVSDARAPEWETYLHAHENWWRQVWRSQYRQGLSFSTLTPEWGPPPYMPTLPYTRQPVASLDEIVLWMARRQRDLFAQCVLESDNGRK